MRNRSAIIGYALLTLILTAGAAQGLAGTDTVTSDDVVNETLTSADVKNESLTSSDIKNESLRSSDVLNNSLTGSDINEATLALPRMHEAQVSASGSRKHGDAVDADRISAGVYDVRFNGFDVRNCMWVVSEADFPNGGPLSHKRQVLSVKTDDDFNDVRVYVTSNDSLGRADASFTLLGVCR